MLATLNSRLGIDPAVTLPDRLGRPMYVLDDREPVRELAESPCGLIHGSAVQRVAEAL